MSIFRDMVMEYEKELYRAIVIIEEAMVLIPDDVVFRATAKHYLDRMEDEDYWFFIDPNTGKEKADDAEISGYE